MGFFDHLTPSKGAKFSRCRKYRYSLWRGWDARRPKLAIVGLNPSTANELHNDPTITRCIGFAKLWGFGRLVMLNAFAYRSPKRSKLKVVEDPVGPDNDYYLLRECDEADKIIVAWGNDGGLMQRDAIVLELLEDYKLWCFGMTRRGSPIHPLYVPNSVKLIRFRKDL